MFDQLDMLTTLNISRNQLDGEIPGNLANLTHLSSLDLSQNKLRGMIPESLGHTPSLKHLNLLSNQLEGSVPETSIFRNMSATSLLGNPSLCGASYLKPCRSKSH